MRPLLIAAALIALGLPASAADVISRAPDRAGVTIYRDEGIDDPASANWGGYGLAMIAEERTIDLPAGESRIVFQGVADGALPPSASLHGVPGRIVEQNFDYEVLSPGALARHAVGGTVHVVRTNAKTGTPTIEDAVLRSGPNGLVLDFGGRVEAFQCSGGYERLVYDNLPPDLSGKAQLSTRVRVARAGRYKLRLSYLTVGLAWKASYVARVTPDGTGLDLTGWITLANHGDTTFANAPTSVVAGRLARQAVELSRPVVAHRAAACWPTGNSHHPRGEQLWVMQAEPVADELREVTIAGSMMARGMMAPMAMPAPARHHPRCKATLATTSSTPWASRPPWPHGRPSRWRSCTRPTSSSTRCTSTRSAPG